MKKMRIVMLGVAHMHSDLWAEAWLNHNDVEFVGVWDHDCKRAEQWSKKFGVKTFENIEEALSHDVADAVGICAENVYHAELAVKAAQSGLDILCEKPSATTLSDCDKIKKAVDDNNVRFMQGFPMRVDPVNYKIKQMLNDNFIGKVTMFRKRHGIGWAAAKEGNVPENLSWFIDKKLSGGGALLDEGIHAMDFIRWMFGDPISVQAVIQPGATGLSVEDGATVMFEFANNVTGVLQTAWTFRAGTNTTEIFGNKGTIIQQFNDCASTTVNGESNFPLQVYSENIGELGWSSLRIPTVFQQIHQRVAEKFVDCLVSGEEFPSGIEEGRAALKMVLAAYKAAETGKKIFLEEVE